MKFSAHLVTLLRRCNPRRGITLPARKHRCDTAGFSSDFSVEWMAEDFNWVECWAVFSTSFALFIHSRMLVQKPSHRALRRVIRELEVVMSVGNAALLILLSGSITNMIILILLYLVSASLTSELHGRRWIQFD